MRQPRYLSPTSLSKFESDRTEFYLTYLADNPPPRLPQTQPMSVGSAFDAYVKSHIHKVLTGRSDAQFQFETIFENQVEPHNRDWALVAGKHVFDTYVSCGALADLLLEMSNAAREPRFEFTVEARVAHSGIIAEPVAAPAPRCVPLLGKPDAYFVNREGARCVVDWKVNGYCGSGNTSPVAGYTCLRPGGKAHKDATVVRKNGLMINIGHTLDQVAPDWAAQTATYAWLLGEAVGGDFVVGIDQIVGKGNPFGQPSLRVARHRCRVAAAFQRELLDRYLMAWETIASGHIFTELSVEDSRSRCAVLDTYHQMYSGDERDQWLMSVVRDA